MMFSAMARLRPGVTPEQAGAEGTARARQRPDLKQTALALFGNNGPAGDDRAAGARRDDRGSASGAPDSALLPSRCSSSRRPRASSSCSCREWRGGPARSRFERRLAPEHARLVRQWLVESSLLGVAGAAAGLLMAMLLHRALPAVLPAGFPRVDDVRLDWRVAMFACGVALARQPGVRHGPRISGAT